MSMNFEHDAAPLERLSALVDGELDAAAVRSACNHWRDDRDARSTWHAYQLIGDVLRSDDLACTSARDTAFLAAFRIRLQSEPVVLAPQPVEPVESSEPVMASRGTGATVAPASLRAAGGARRGRLAWVAPSAVAAGFVAVAGVLVLNGRPGGPVQVQSALELAQTATTGSTGSTVNRAPAGSMSLASGDAEPPSVVADGRLIRSVRLDRYLAAHKQFAGSSALGVPSAFLRNATATESER